LRGQDWRLTAAIATPERDYQIKSPTNPFSRKLVGRRGCALRIRRWICHENAGQGVARVRAGRSHRRAGASLQNPMRRPYGKQCTKISQSGMFENADRYFVALNKKKFSWCSTSRR
jgi:hypothetical protein